jgi:hypothetical protein|tara:strand:- start:143 stop:313 length:171 start_codon:yes stop_codon:yes gene_type:complete
MSFIKYKLYKDPISSEINVVNKIYTNRTLSIPFDEANTDYQEYLEWAKTNTAEEAD